MMNGKQFTVAILFSLILLTLSFTSISNQQGGDTYDPWLDYNEDGVIDVNDIYHLSKAYGASGSTTRSMNVTNWPSTQNVNVINPPIDLSISCLSAIPQTGRVVDRFSFDVADDENVAINNRWFIFKQGTGTINIQDDTGYHRDALRIHVSDGTGDFTLAKPLMSLLPLGKFGMEFLYKPAFSAGNSDHQFYFGFEWHVGGSTSNTDQHVAEIKIEFRTTGNGNVKVYCRNENNNYQLIKDYGCPLNNLWFTDVYLIIKLVVDFENKNYLWLQLGQDIFDLSVIKYRVYQAVTNSWWFPFIKIENNGAYALSGYVDNLVITADEKMH